MAQQAPPVERGPGIVAARMGAALAVGLGALAVLRPFLSAIAWGAILAYVTWPLFRRLRAWARRPRLAAALFAAGVAVGLGIPVGVLLVTLADEASGLVSAFLDWRAAGAPLPAWIGESELLARGVESLGGLLPADPAGLIATAGTQVSGSLVSVASGIARNAFTFGFTFVVLYGFYVGGEELLALGRRLAPLLFPSAPERFFESLGESVRAVVFGLILTALVQGILAGGGMAVAGIPSAVALGAATSLLAFLPGGGGAISLCAAAWLAFQGEIAWAIGLALWTVLVVSSIDNVLRPIIISEQGGIPFVMVFFGVIGGLATFGLIGLFVGPVLLSVAYTLLQELSRTPPPAPRRPPAPGP